MEQPQPQLQTEPQTELHTDDTQKNKNTKNKNADCSRTADSTASADLQKNKGWYKMHDKTDHNLDFNLKKSQIPNRLMVICSKHINLLA